MQGKNEAAQAAVPGAGLFIPRAIGRGGLGLRAEGFGELTGASPVFRENGEMIAVDKSQITGGNIVKNVLILALGIGILVLTQAVPSYAGPPLNNLEGVGGIAFNPLAYTAGASFDKDGGSQAGFSCKDVLSKPQAGFWYVSLSDVKVDWTAIGIAQTYFKRLELSYGYEAIAPNGENIHKNNIGGKLLLLNENTGGLKYVPAVSAGAVYKKTSGAAAGVDSSDLDYYLVATKLITSLPVGVLLSGGVLSTKGLATGVFGFDDDRDETVFANIDVIPVPQLALGFEYKQGARFDDFKNADYYDVHAAWFFNKNLTLVGAYVNAGDEESTSRVGLGDGVVLSAQYAF
jgi:hypothetical protein